MRSRSSGFQWRDELGAGREGKGERRAAVNKRLWRTDVGELPHYSLACSRDPPPLTAYTYTQRNTHWRGGEAKQSFGVNSWDAWDGCGRFCKEKPEFLKPTKKYVYVSGKHNSCIFWTVWFCRNATCVRMCQSGGLQPWITLLPCGTYGRADKKQLPLWAAFR